MNPINFKVTDADLAVLEASSGGMTLSAYIRSKLGLSPGTEKLVRSRRPSRRLEAEPKDKEERRLALIDAVHVLRRVENVQQQLNSRATNAELAIAVSDLTAAIVLYSVQLFSIRPFRAERRGIEKTGGSPK